MSSEAAAPATHRVPEKRRQILAGAREVFREAGYERASVDVIAARAGVSKATVYNHFADKKALFVASVVEATDELRAKLTECFACSGAGVEQALQSIGERIMTLWLAPDVAALYWQAISESARLPEIGRMVYEQGTLPLRKAIAEQLGQWRGALRVDDADAAAVAFIALCSSDLLTRMRLGVLEHPVEAEVRDAVGRGVRTFLRAYAR